MRRKKKKKRRPCREYTSSDIVDQGDNASWPRATQPSTACADVGRHRMQEGEKNVPASSQEGLSRVGHARPLNTNACADQPTNDCGVHESCTQGIRGDDRALQFPSEPFYSLQRESDTDEAQNNQSCLSTCSQNQTDRALGAQQWRAQGSMISHRTMKVRRGRQTAPTEPETRASIPCSAEALQKSTENPDVNCQTESGQYM